MLTSQGLVLATAMAVSAGTIFLFDHLRYKYFPHPPQFLGNRDFATDRNRLLIKSCLSSGSRKREKKRVRFANDVKDSKGNGELYRKTHRQKNCAEIRNNNTCGNEVLEIRKMAPNRAVLYSGILKDRVQRMEYSY